MTDYDKKIDEIVDSLGCSIAEAMEIIKADKQIDKGERTAFDLSPEQEKQALKYANVKEHKKKATPQKREREPDTVKENIIQNLFEFLQNQDFTNVEITNKSKLITFTNENDNFELMLTRKRKAKK